MVVMARVEMTAQGVTAIAHIPPLMDVEGMLLPRSETFDPPLNQCGLLLGLTTLIEERVLLEADEPGYLPVECFVG